MEKTFDINVRSFDPFISPKTLAKEIPISESAGNTVISAREQIKNILLKKDHRLLIIVGPCSIHDERAALEDIASRRLEGQEVPEQYEVRRLRKDGKAIWGEMMATTIEYEGRPAIMGNMIDITERKRAEEALRDSEERFRAFLDNLGDIAYEANARGELTYANKTAEIITGIPRKDVIGKPFLSFFTKERVSCINITHSKESVII